MNTHWPRVEARVTRRFRATHSLPGLGNAAPHSHDYEVVFGYCQEINPTRGVSKCSLSELLAEVDATVALVDGKDLNAVLPVTPTAEWLACWLLVNVGCDANRRTYTWEFVIVRAYGCFETRAEMLRIPEKWRDLLRARVA